MQEKLKILHLEDLPSDAELVAQELAKSTNRFEIFVVDNKKDFENALKEFSPDIILSNNPLQSFNLMEALLVMKNEGIKVPLIVIATTLSVEFAVEIMKTGAADCILKDHIQQLPGAIFHVLEKHNSELALQKNLEKKLAVLEQKIAAQSAQLEETNKDLESFHHSVSADLRSPLQVITNYVFILGKKYIDRADYDAQLILTSIKSNIKQMGFLIGDLLSLSNLAHTIPSKVSVNMNELVKTAIAEAILVNKTKEIKIILHDLPPAYADEALLKKVWITLITNAFKYTTSVLIPKIEIGIEQNSNKIAYYIKSNGSGFDMQNVDHLFDVFQPLHKSTELEQTAIGLALIHRIISKHEGSVWAVSKPGEGSTFYFSLPDKNEN